MSTITFEKLEPEYRALAARAIIKPERERELRSAAVRLLRDKATYAIVSQKTDIPIAVLMALAEREMTGNLHCYLGNGQSLKKRTTIVPKGRGPFLQPFPEDFIAGCLDALAIDRLDQVAHQAGGWSLARFCYESEEWNGWGYRARGIPSPYVFGATSVQRAGKFPRDHFFDPTMMDPQLGTLAIVEELVRLDPSLVFGDLVTKVDDAPPLVPVAPHPVMATTNVKWVQDALNKLKVPAKIGLNHTLKTDGDVGRETRLAVRYFEQQHHLSVDRGIPGPQVVAALKEALAQAGL